MKPYIQPFERVLALRELQSLAAADARPLGLLEETSTEFEVISVRSLQDLANRLSYWESIEHATESMLTTQSLRESTVNLVRTGVAVQSLRQQLPFNGDVPLPQRRCLRYGTHGVHEYRGKFFPQLVKSLINISGIHPGAVVGDPMSGSGTTVVEAILSNCCGLGIDMNPLSVFLGSVKARLLSADAEKLASSYARVRSQLVSGGERTTKRLHYFHSLSSADQLYLSSWFSKPILFQLDHIALLIRRVRDKVAADLMRIALSNILRRVSWQKEDDLRVRKEVHPQESIDAEKEFLDELDRSFRAVLAFLFQNGLPSNPRFDITEGDARRCASHWGRCSLDLIVTSPPYATALPYLDTDRLSLIYLGLLPRPDHRSKDQEMIGNREISEKVRRQYWDRFKSDGEQLPGDVRDLIWRVNSLNEKVEVGFRRRNLPALLAKYFFDMRDVMTGMHLALKPKRFANVVVGNNHTIAGGIRVDIQTPSLLRQVAQAVGFVATESLSMDMLISRDIFRKNAVSSEEILLLYKPA